MTPMIAGTALALIALAFVLYPLFQEPIGLRTARNEVRRERGSTAVDALREIEFDHVTGKLSETDYAELKWKYTQRAVSAMRAGESGDTQTVCDQCGPRPEPNAAFCSECGRSLAA